MKNRFLAAVLLLLASATIPSCDLGEDDPRYTTAPTIISIENSGETPNVTSGTPVLVQADILNPYGVLYAYAEYEVTWTDEEGDSRKETGSTNRRTYRASAEKIYFEALLPAQDSAGKTNMQVSWFITAENEYGLSSSTDTKTYRIL